MRITRWIPFALALSACAADPLTEIVVVADTDLSVPDAIDTLRIVVASSAIS